MYPDRELTRLAAHKTALRRSIARHRQQCTGSAVRALQPLAWLDRAVAFWRRLPPLVKFAAVPLGFLLKRRAAPRPGLLGTLFRWGPVVFSAVRGLAPARHR